MKEVAVMDKKREEDFLRLIGLRGTILILRFLNIVDSAQYKHLRGLLNT